MTRALLVGQPLRGAWWRIAVAYRVPRQCVHGPPSSCVGNALGGVILRATEGTPSIGNDRCCGTPLRAARIAPARTPLAGGERLVDNRRVPASGRAGHPHHRDAALPGLHPAVRLESLER